MKIIKRLTYIVDLILIVVGFNILLFNSLLINTLYKYESIFSAEILIVMLICSFIAIFSNSKFNKLIEGINISLKLVSLFLLTYVYISLSHYDLKVSLTYLSVIIIISLSVLLTIYNFYKILTSKVID